MFHTHVDLDHTVGPFRVSPTATVFIADPKMHAALRTTPTSPAVIPTIDLAFSIIGNETERTPQHIHIGPAVNADFSPDALLILTSSPVDIEVFKPTADFGCRLYDLPVTRPAVLLRRGQCTFSRKALLATQAGASAAIVINTDDDLFVPGGDADLMDSSNNTASVGQVQDGVSMVPLLLVGNATGAAVEAALGNSSSPDHIVIVRASGRPPPSPAEPMALEDIPVVVNGLRLLNAKLVPAA